MPLRSFTQAELVLTERRRVERPLLLLIWLSVSAFSLAEGKLFYLLAGSAAVIVNLMMVYRAKELYVDRLFVNIGVLAATGLLAVEFLAKDSMLLVVLGHYLILIQLCKLFERKTNRDYVQMLALSLLLMVAAGLVNEGLWYALTAAVYIVLGCHTAMVFTLKRGLDAAAAARLVTETAPLSPHRVAWNVIRDWPARAIRRRLVLAVTAILVSAVAVFLTVPRAADVAERMFNLSGSSSSAGFTNRVHLGEPRNVELSDHFVMRVSVLEGSAEGVLPHSASYLRGQVFYTYRNSRWKWSSPARKELPPFTNDLLTDALVLKVAMVPTMLPKLFAPYPTVRVDVESPGGSARVGPYLQVSMDSSPIPAGLAWYTAYCLPRPFAGPQMQYLAYVQRTYPPPFIDPTDGVDVTEKVQVLAREWCAELVQRRDAAEQQGDALARDRCDLAIAERILQRLQERCSYSLDLTSAEASRDGVEDFLFHMRRGHCEYFATAMAVMCRALGVPARLATGFAVSEENRTGGHYIVRERDAHAWTEVYTPGTDWVVMDPTPPGGRHVGRGGWLKKLKDFWEGLQFLWYDKVLSYDSAARRELGGLLQGGLARLWRSIREAAEALRESFTALLLRGEVDRILVRFIAVAGAAWFVVLGLILFRMVRRRILNRRVLLRNPAMSPRFLEFLRRLLDLLRRHGISPRRQQTLFELAAEAAERLDLPAGALRDLVGLYYRMRWGGIVPRPEEISAAEDQVRQLSSLVSARP